MKTPATLIGKAASLCAVVFIYQLDASASEVGDTAGAIDASSVKASHQRAKERGPGGAFAIPRDLDGAMLGFRGALPASHLRALERGPGGAFAIGE